MIVYLSICLSVCLFVCLSICKLENAAILRDFLNFWTWQNQKRSNSTLSAELTASYQCVLRFFPLHLPKVLRLSLKSKVMQGHTKCCTCHAKSSEQSWRSDAPKCNPSQEISALASEQLWWTCLLYCACHAKDIFADPLPTPAIVFETATKPSRIAHFWPGAESLATPNSAPKLRCFVRFDFETCFAQQRRALFRYHNFQKWSDVGVFCTCWLRNLLRATTACNFSSLIWPAGSAPAALASLLFNPPEPKTIGNT